MGIATNSGSAGSTHGSDCPLSDCGGNGLLELVGHTVSYQPIGLPGLSHRQKRYYSGDQYHTLHTGRLLKLEMTQRACRRVPKIQHSRLSGFAIVTRTIPREVWKA